LFVMYSAGWKCDFAVVALFIDLSLSVCVIM
jgi:hypothetical protein